MDVAFSIVVLAGAVVWVSFELGSIAKALNRIADTRENTREYPIPTIPTGEPAKSERQKVFSVRVRP